MTPQRARELLNQFADCSEEVRSALLTHELKGENMTTQKELDDWWNSLPWDENDSNDDSEPFFETLGEGIGEWHDFEDEDLESFVRSAATLFPQPKPAVYNSALFALCHGTQHRALLLKDGYTFDAAHSMKDVQPCEFEGEGYPLGGTAITLTVTKDNRLELSEVKFEGIAGEIFGSVMYNECGLIAYLPMLATAQGGELVIRGK